MTAEAAPFIRVETPAVRDAWPLVRDRLADMASRRRLKNAWTVEDVYLQLMLGQVHLWMTPDARAFVVLAVVREPYQSDLHIWIGHNIADANGAAYMPQLLDIAAENHCERVTFSSTRKGWRRLFPEAEVEYHYAIRVGGSDVEQEANEAGH